MEFRTLYPPSVMSNRFVQEGYNKEWTREEDKLLEYALVLYNKDTPEQWVKVASVFQMKTVFDVIKRYKKLQEVVSEIEVGRVSFPDYRDSSFTLKAVSNHNNEGSKKTSPTMKSTFGNERKEKLHWTKEDHERFLEGLLKCGRGKWRDIARRFVGTKTPSQVASHAQKHFIRQNLSKEGKDNNRRASIHDITTLDIIKTTTPDEDKSPPFQEFQMPSSHQNQTSIQNVQPEWVNHDYDDELLMKKIDLDIDVSPQSSSFKTDSSHENQTSIQSVQPELINHDYDVDELLMEIFDSDIDVTPQSPSFKMDSPHQNQTSIQNVQPEWINHDDDFDELLMKIFDSDIDVAPQSPSFKMDSPHQNQTSIQNVDLEWIDQDYNDELLKKMFNPETDATSQSPSFKMNSLDFNNDDSFWEFP